MLLLTKKIYTYFSLFVFSLSLFACSDDSTVTPLPQSDKGKIALEFDNIVGDKNLVLDGFTYASASGENFKVSKFNYFISNIKLTKENGQVHIIPQDSSYFLVKEDTKASQIITLNNIPTGKYKAIEFMFGVDSLRNTMPVANRTGVLDPANGEAMYWAWNSGYIFTKLEGTFATPSDAAVPFQYHIGLFGGYNEKTVNNTRIIKIPFGSSEALVSTTKTPQVHFMVDVLKFLNGSGTNLKFSEHNAIMGANQPLSQKVANNYAQMFSIDHIH